MENIVIWGTGSLASLFLEQKSQDYNILFVVEGQHTPDTPDELLGNRVISKEEYFSSEHADHNVMICSTFFGEISSELNSHGIGFDRIKIAIAGDYKITVTPAMELDPSIEDYIEGQKICRDLYNTLQSDKNVTTFPMSDTAKYELLKHGFEHVESPGLNMEFGVFQGESIRYLAGVSDQMFYGFDSFEGLPEYWVAGHKAGTFDQGGAIPEAPGNVKFVKGWFDKTLTGFLAENPGPVGFLHMDADLYSSTIYVLNELKDRIRKGTVIVFDEYNYFLDPTFAEKKAFEEFTAENNIKYVPISQTIHSVGFRIV